MVTVIAQPLFQWLLALIRGTSVAQSFGLKLRAAFSKENRRIFYDLLNVAFWAAFLVRFAFAEAAPTRVDILLMIGSVVMLLIALLNLLWDIATIATRRERERNPIQDS